MREMWRMRDRIGRGRHGLGARCGVEWRVELEPMPEFPTQRQTRPIGLRLISGSGC